jgi:lipoate-protein ligase B
VVACGLHDVEMTSLERELPEGAGVDSARFRAHVAEEFARSHGRAPRYAEREQIAPAEFVA